MSSSAYVNDQSVMMAGIAKEILFCPAEERTARELRQLPKAARERVWADMTANPEATIFRVNSEDPAFVVQKLHELDAALHEFDHEVWNQVSQNYPGYVNDVAFRLMFLRCDDFDIPATVDRIGRHFDDKLKLFGPHVLGRDVYLSDLSSDDIESLEAGGMQILPLRDQAGRSIVFTRQRNYKYKERENLLRAFWYTAMKTIKDEQSQRLGFVSISYQASSGYNVGGYDHDLTRRISKLVKAVPVRFCSIYVCFSETPWQRVADLISHMLSPFLRVRLRSIQGSHQELLYKLMALGIPPHVLPVTDNGDSLTANHHKWLQQQEIAECKDLGIPTSKRRWKQIIDSTKTTVGIVEDDDDDDDEIMEHKSMNDDGDNGDYYYGDDDDISM